MLIIFHKLITIVVYPNKQNEQELAVHFGSWAVTKNNMKFYWHQNRESLSLLFSALESRSMLDNQALDWKQINVKIHYLIAVTLVLNLLTSLDSPLGPFLFLMQNYVTWALTMGIILNVFACQAYTSLSAFLCEQIGACPCACMHVS